MVDINQKISSIDVIQKKKLVGVDQKITDQIR